MSRHPNTFTVTVPAREFYSRMGDHRQANSEYGRTAVVTVNSLGEAQGESPRDGVTYGLEDQVGGRGAVLAEFLADLDMAA